jgi:hypothetical protein
MFKHPYRIQYKADGSGKAELNWSFYNPHIALERTTTTDVSPVFLPNSFPDNQSQRSSHFRIDYGSLTAGIHYCKG